MPIPFQPYTERLEPANVLRDAISNHEPYILLLDSRIATNVDKGSLPILLRRAAKNIEDET